MTSNIYDVKNDTTSGRLTQPSGNNHLSSATDCIIFCENHQIAETSPPLLYNLNSQIWLILMISLLSFSIKNKKIMHLIKTDKATVKKIFESIGALSLYRLFFMKNILIV